MDVLGPPSTLSWGMQHPLDLMFDFYHGFTDLPRILHDYRQNNAAWRKQPPERIHSNHTQIQQDDDYQSDDDDLVCLNDDWIPSLKLTVKDKMEIIDGRMLSDKHMFAAQRLLQKQFPRISGFQDTCLSQTDFLPIGHGGVQIHHVRGNHWILSSSFDGQVTVYDSVYSKMTSDLEKQLVDVYGSMACVDTGELFVELTDCQKQCGSTDCGLFVVAWLLEQCSGRQRRSRNTYFDQSQMRNHFVNCLEQGVMTPFPVISSRSKCAQRSDNLCVIDTGDYV